MSDRLPSNHVAIPIHWSQTQAALRVGVLVRSSGSAEAGQLVMLREALDGRVYLGCLLDARDVVHHWLEIWVQHPGAAAAVPSQWGSGVSNGALDTRWRGWWSDLGVLDEAGQWDLGETAGGGLATWLDVEAGRSVHAGLSPDAPWVLCEDESLLSSAGLPAYATTLYRYLHDPSGEARFAALGDDSPQPEGVELSSLDDLVPDRQRLLPFNPEAGRVGVRLAGAVDYESYLSVLGGGSWSGLAQGQGPVRVSESHRWLAREESIPAGLAEGRLFFEASGRSGRLQEALYLKLRLLLDAAVGVRSFIARNQRPLLNLSPASFQVRLSEAGAALPFLWTGRLVLSDPGEAQALPVESTDRAYFVTGAPADSVYCPDARGRWLRGQGQVRLRRVIGDDPDGAVIEATLRTDETITPGRQDLIWLRLPLQDGAVSMYGRVESGESQVVGEWRFRSFAREWEASTIESLRASEGALLPQTPFEVLPLLSTPCDLYALGVMMVRSLLVDEQVALPIALDELWSLGRQLDAQDDAEASSSLADRVETLMEQGDYWWQSLGPQRVLLEEIEPEQAHAILPPRLWCQVLATMLRAFPGLTGQSICRDTGDAPPRALQQVIDPLVKELGSLVRQCRSLLIADWDANAEVQAVIRQLEAEV